MFVLLVPQAGPLTREVCAPNAQWARTLILVASAETVLLVILPLWVACAHPALMDTPHILVVTVCHVLQAPTPSLEVCVSPVLKDTVVPLEPKNASPVVPAKPLPLVVNVLTFVVMDSSTRSLLLLAWCALRTPSPTVVTLLALIVLPANMLPNKAPLVSLMLLSVVSCALISITLPTAPAIGSDPLLSSSKPNLLISI